MDKYYLLLTLGFLIIQFVNNIDLCFLIKVWIRSLPLTNLPELALDQHWDIFHSIHSPLHCSRFGIGQLGRSYDHKRIHTGYHASLPYAAWSPRHKFSIIIILIGLQGVTRNITAERGWRSSLNFEIICGITLSKSYS